MPQQLKVERTYRILQLNIENLTASEIIITEQLEVGLGWENESLAK